MKNIKRHLPYLVFILALAACSPPTLASQETLKKIDPKTTPATGIRIMAELPEKIIPDPERPLIMSIRVGRVIQQYQMVIKPKEQKSLRRATGRRLFVYGLSNQDAAALERLRKTAGKTTRGAMDIDGGACSLGPVNPRKLKGTVWIKTAELDAYEPVFDNILSKGTVPFRPCP